MMTMMGGSSKELRLLSRLLLEVFFAAKPSTMASNVTFFEAQQSQVGQLWQRLPDADVQEESEWAARRDFASDSCL